MPMKVAIFQQGMHTAAEKEINAWLDERRDKIDVNYVTQSQGASGPGGTKVWLSIWYTESQYK